MFNKSPFGQQNTIKILDDTEIVFVSDMFVEDYVGGAELTSEALIKSTDFKVQKIHSKDVTNELLQTGYERYWIFGNFANLDNKLIPTIVGNLRYSILEYDYKYCKFRSPQKHQHATGQACDCHNDLQGKLVSAFFHGAKSLWWMSEAQMLHYTSLFPFLSENINTVLSSVFDEKFFLQVKMLNEKNLERDIPNLVLNSPSWVKGADNAKEHCKKEGLEFELAWNIPYEQMLEKLARTETLIYLPNGWDTCPRLVIEAKMLGCNIVVNDNVQHAREIWFNTNDRLDTESYLYAARERFWTSIKVGMEWRPTLSGYTTTYNCKTQYTDSWKRCVDSMLEFCDEIVVVDGGSDDGTWEELVELASKEDRLVIHQHKIDWDSTRFAVEDGGQKARARDLCTMDFCWQMDADEYLPNTDYDKLFRFLRTFPQHVDVLCLPVVEYWGSKNKVRIDVNPWKWRLTRNDENITHGIPVNLRAYDENNLLYAKPGTDGCDYIHKETGHYMANMNFYDNSVHKCRLRALSGDQDALDQYTIWYTNCVDILPSVRHLSWFDISRKVKLYRNYWQRHWESLYNIKVEDTSDNNMFFDKPWSDVTDEEISELSEKLATQMGGWIFHTKVNWNKNVPSIYWTKDD